ncbi:MAG: GNAT family N-acetyltransferase [Litorimonas sp.]
MTLKPVIRINAPDALPRFAQLNAQWIQDLHVMEPSDKLMLARPEIYTENGSYVFSAHIAQFVAGACALKCHDDGQYELTKMAVDPEYRGQGIGQYLIEFIHDYAKTELSLQKLFLLSNTKNAAALRLYTRNGWTVNHEGPHPVYARANIGMEKWL